MKRISLLLIVLLIGLSLAFAGGKKEAMSEKDMEGPTVKYTDLETAAKYAEKGPTVLFFNADWCPACQAASKDLAENGAMLAKGITVVKVNYDKSSELKTKYGVTSQHTFVQIDTNGEKLKIWSGGGVEEINKQVK